MALDEIRNKIRAAERAAGRADNAVTLIAVSKLQPDARVTEALNQGQRIFGENYVQEAQGKWPGWREHYDGVDLHLIGPLQSNKARAAVQLFDAIHSVDRISLARKIAAAIQGEGRAPKLFVQVNTGDEPQKAGVLPDDLLQFLAQLRDLDLTISGLMCIPPATEPPARHFDLLRTLAGHAGLSELSMGMSADFETAIAHGATHIRVGSAIFGDRPPRS